VDISPVASADKSGVITAIESLNYDAVTQGEPRWTRWTSVTEPGLPGSPGGAVCCLANY
jgi:hypothetical protein